MRKIVTTTMISLDGVMQAPGGSKEDAAEGFEYGGWQSGWDEEADHLIDTKVHTEGFEMIFGRRTYDIFLTYWPEHKDEKRWGRPFNETKKYVVSHEQIELPWNNSELITGDIVEEIKKLKGTNGPDLLIYGSGKLIQTLLKNNLIDRMHIWTFPLTIGSGHKLFAEGTQPQRFKPIDAKVTKTGLIYACYELAEPLKKSE